MKEYIKSGFRISLEINSTNGYDHWANVNMLREKIKKLKQFQEVAPEYYTAIKDVLALLEEKK